MKHDFFECCFILHETVDIFRDIEDDDYHYQQTYCEEECADIFFKYVPIQLLHNQILRVTLGNIMSRHEAKSPSMICLRASFTSQR